MLDRKCQRVAIESTGVYWIPTYTLLEGKVETIVANPFQIKNIPGRKNDILDSEWIAELCLNGQIIEDLIIDKLLATNEHTGRERFKDVYDLMVLLKG